MTICPFTLSLEEQIHAYFIVLARMLIFCHCSRRTPLHHAALRGNLDVCRLLLEHKADVQAQTSRFQAILLFFGFL